MQLKSPCNPGSENLDTISSFRVPSSSSRKNDGIFVLAVGGNNTFGGGDIFPNGVKLIGRRDKRQQSKSHLPQYCLFVF